MGIKKENAQSIIEGEGRKESNNLRIKIHLLSLGLEPS